MMISIEEFPTLLLDRKVLKTINKLSENDKKTVLTELGKLNVYGMMHETLDVEALKPRKKYSPIKELKTKITKQEFRFLVIKIPEDHNDRKRASYAVLHSFIKKTKAIKEKDKEIALGVKKREGY